MPDTPRSDQELENSPIIPVWVVGELGVLAADLEDKGAVQAVQDDLGHTGFQVTHAQPV